MWRSCNWVVRWETLAVLKQDLLCWSRGRCWTWSFFFFCFFFAFNVWVSIQAALLLYTAHLISKLSLNCWYSHKIVSAELRANASYLKGLSLNWIVRNSRHISERAGKYTQALQLHWKKCVAEIELSFTHCAACAQVIGHHFLGY